MVRKKENKSVIWKFGWMEIIAWFSVVLFLVDYSIRTGDWWFELIAIFFVVTSFGAVVRDILRSREWKEESYYSKLKKRLAQ